MQFPQQMARRVPAWWSVHHKASNSAVAHWAREVAHFPVGAIGHLEARRLQDFAVHDGHMLTESLCPVFGCQLWGHLGTSQSFADSHLHALGNARLTIMALCHQGR